MNNEEIQSLINQLKATGKSDEEIMGVFYDAFTNGDMDRADLETLANAMGYELTDDFKNEAAPDPINAGNENPAPANIEEQAKEFKENIDDKGNGERAAEELNRPGSAGNAEAGNEDGGNKGEGEGENKPASESDSNEEDDEEKEWQEAQKKLKW